MNEALIHKAWLETRWRFITGLVLMLCSAVGTILLWPRVQELLPLADKIPINGEIGERIRAAVALSSQFNGYVWSQWFGKNMPEFGTLFAVLLGTGGLLAQSSGGAALFTLSLPVSRARLLGARTATGLVEMLVLVIVSSMAVPLLSPAVGKSYGVGEAMIHAMCAFIAATVFFSMAALLSTEFADIWRPLLFPLLLGAAVSLAEQIPRDSSIGIFKVMSAESYFKSGEIPWVGLMLCIAATAAMLYGATVNLRRRDF